MKTSGIGLFALLVVLVMLAAGWAAWRSPFRDGAEPQPTAPDMTSRAMAPNPPAEPVTPGREARRTEETVATSERPGAAGRDPAATPRAPRPGPTSAPAPPLRWLSAEDEVKLDAMAIARETGSGQFGRKDPDVAEYNARFEREERDPAWASVREDAIRAVLEQRRGQLADVRVGAPVCKASICLMRAIIESTENDRLSAWSRASEHLLIPPIQPGGFTGASTSFERVDGETVALSYLFRHEPPGN